MCVYPITSHHPRKSCNLDYAETPGTTGEFSRNTYVSSVGGISLTSLPRRSSVGRHQKKTTTRICISLTNRVALQFRKMLELPSSPGSLFVLSTLSLIILERVRTSCPPGGVIKKSDLDPALLPARLFEITFPDTIGNILPQLPRFKFAHFSIATTADGSHFYLGNASLIRHIMEKLFRIPGRACRISPNECE